MGQWPKLIRYLDHPQLTVGQQHLRADHPAIRDRAQERVVLRQPARGRRSALLYRLIDIAKANGREPVSPRTVQEAALARTRADWLALLPCYPAAAVTAVNTGFATRLQLDVVVERHLHFQRLHQLEALRGQRLQGSTLDPIEQLAP